MPTDRIKTQNYISLNNIFKDYAQLISRTVEPSWIHVGMNRKPGVAEFFTFKKFGQKQLQQDAEDFNMSQGDYLFSLLADSENNLDDYLVPDKL